LFYLALDGSVMAVPVSTSTDGFRPGTPAVLFKGPPNPDGWDVSADGKKFLFPVAAGESAQAYVHDCPELDVAVEEIA
jgi:hypothetical protein